MYCTEQYCILLWLHVLHCTVLYCIRVKVRLHCTAQYCTLLLHYRTVRRPLLSSGLYCTIFYWNPVYSTLLYFIVLQWTVMFLMYSTVLLSSRMYCTALNCTVLYCTALYSTALYSTALYSTALYSTALNCTVLHSTSLWRHYVGWWNFYSCTSQPHRSTFSYILMGHRNIRTCVQVVQLHFYYILPYFCHVLCNKF